MSLPADLQLQFTLKQKPHKSVIAAEIHVCPQGKEKFTAAEFEAVRDALSAMHLKYEYRKDAAKLFLPDNKVNPEAIFDKPFVITLRSKEGVAKLVEQFKDTSPTLTSLGADLNELFDGAAKARRDSARNPYQF